MKFIKLKKQHEEEVESEGSWAVSYGDMITLLLSFFVIFFTTDFDKKKQQDMNEHFMSDIATIDFGETSKKKGVDEESAVAVTAQTSAEALMDNLMAQVNGKPSAGSDNYFGNLSKVEVIPWKNNLIIKFKEISFFRSGQVELTGEGEKVLKAFSEKYMPYAGTYKLSVKAFTDRRKVVKVTGRFKDNLELSALRAVAAMRELQKDGIPISMMDIAGHGEMVKIQNYLESSNVMTEEQKNALSRTIVMIIKPEKEESFL